MKDNILQLKKIIDNLDDKTINNINFLEQELIPSLGLNDEILNEQPKELSAFYGKGLHLRIWQYPNQFSKYLGLLFNHRNKIKSYLEIGCRNGGTFSLTCEYIKPLNNAVAVDIIDATETIAEYVNQTSWASYMKIDSHSKEFIDFLNKNFFDLIFIDGDHSYNGVKQDAEITRDKCNIQVFHDISSDVCPGVVSYWNEIKQYHSDIYDFFEFTDQYESVAGNYLGIGVAIRKNWIKRTK